MKKILLFFIITFATFHAYSQYDRVIAKEVRTDTIRKYKANKIFFKDSTLFSFNIRATGKFLNTYSGFTLLNNGTSAGATFSGGGAVYSNGIIITASDTSSVLSYSKSGLIRSVKATFSEIPLRFVRRVLPYSENRIAVKHDSAYVKMNNIYATEWDTTGLLWQHKNSLFSDMVRMTDSSATGAVADSTYTFSTGSDYYIEKGTGFNKGYLNLGISSGGYANLFTSTYGISVYEDATGSGLLNPQPIQVTGNMLAKNNFNVTGDATITGDLKTNRIDATTSDTIEIVEDILIDSTLTVNGNFVTGNSVTDTNNLTGITSAIGSFQHDGWINIKNYGAVSDGVTDNKAAFEAAWAAMSDDGTFYIPDSTFLLASTTRLHNKGNVKIICEGIVLNGLSAVDTLISLSGNTSVYINGLKVNMNNKAAQADVGTYIFNTFGKVTVENSHWYNFGTWNAEGLRLYNVGNDPLFNSYNDNEAFSINKCSFKNDIVIINGSYDWTSNNTKGIGIMVMDSAEYGRISDCDFMNIAGGITLDGGANTTVELNNFEMINAWQNAALQGAAGVYVKDCAGNNGKTTITNNKFNHNWTTCIKSDYDANSTRPLLITNNQFIANQYDPIVIGNSSAFNLNTITNNFFDRCYNSLALPTYPFSVTNRAFIKLTNSSLNDISHNIFFQSPNYAIITYGTGSNKITNNLYYTITTDFDSLTGRNLTFGNVDVNDLDENMFGDSLILSAFMGVGQDANAYSGSMVIAGSLGSQQNVRTAASSATGGGSIALASDDGGNNGSGDRLGYIAWEGRKTSGLTIGATIEGFTGGAYATNFNTEISIFTTNTTSRTKKFTVMGSGGIATPLINTGNIVAATGMTTTMCPRMSYYNGGSAINITAVPQIADGYDGQLMTIIGSSDANTLTLDDGNGLQLAGGISFVIGSGDAITLVYVSALDLWIEISRSDN